MSMVFSILKRDYAHAGLDADANSASIESLANFIFERSGELFGGIDLRSALVEFIDGSPYHRIYWDAYFSGVEGDVLDRVDSMACELDDIIQSAKSK